MTKISAFVPPPDDKPVAARHTEQANQRESWLRQMELAQLSSMDKAHAAMPAAASGPSRWQAIPPAKNAVVQETASRNAAAQRQAASADLHNNPPAAQGSGQAVDKEPARDADDAGAANVAAAMHQRAYATPSAAETGAAAQTDAQQAAGPLGLAALLGSRAAGTPSAASGIDVTEAPAIAARSPQRPALALAGDSDAAQEESTVQDEAAPLPEAGGEAEPGTQPNWQKRMMHLTGNGQDMQLWIRDSALDQAGSAQLLARVASDMASVGLRLKGATINGKPALPDDAGNAPAPAGIPLISMNTKEDHGTR